MDSSAGLIRFEENVEFVALYRMLGSKVDHPNRYEIKIKTIGITL